MAFGKVILLGEHAVVHGQPALAGALGMGVTATARRRGGEPSSLAIPAWGATATSADASPLGAALAAIAHAVAGPGAWFDVTATAELPPGAGLGSSAALSVAATRAIAAAAGRTLSTDEVERIAGLAEQCFHDNPSGIDVALSARGGLGLYRRGAGLAPVRAAPVALAIALSGEPRATAAMVRRVAAAIEADGSHRRRIETLGELASEGAASLERGRPERLGPLFDTAHDLLAALGVATPALDLLARTARAAGALGAKLTGAGGGGAVIALAPGREAEVIDAWRAAGFDGFAAACGVSA